VAELKRAETIAVKQAMETMMQIHGHESMFLHWMIKPDLPRLASGGFLTTSKRLKELMYDSSVTSDA
jgi:hypothetical protein